MTNTINYSLNKPEETDKVNLNLLNENMDIIDQNLRNTSDNIQNAIETTNSHIQNTENPHEVTKIQIGLDKVENKSSSDIRNEISRDNIVNSLGYIPCSAEDVDTKISGSEIRLQQAIDETFIENLSGVKITQDSEGKWGYMPPGTNSVIPFNSTIGETLGTVFQIKATTDFVKITPEIQEG